MGPGERYRLELADGTLRPDTRQAEVVKSLQRLYQELTAEPEGWWIFKKAKAAQGLYIYGSVGRGKTHLMDLFYESLPSTVGKKRQHYHAFMLWVHRQLRRFDSVSDPIEQIGRQLAKEIRVLCLDEFLVNDIANAMLLAGLLKTLHRHQIALVTTSNVRPDDLYHDGLQRARFLPAIAWINAEMEVMRLDGVKDYRYQQSADHEHWYFPNNDSSMTRLTEFFADFVSGPVTHDAWQVNGRSLPVVKSGESILWCDFKTLCGEARGADDYLAIAAKVNYLLVQNIPVLTADNDDQARRFITLIDILYEHPVALVCHANCHYENIYRGQRLAFEFERARSRLTELLRRHN